MAIFFSSSGSGSGWPILSLKVLLTSATVLSMAVLMKASVPAITGFVVCEVPSVYGSMLSWLRPPYLYIIINCIIISIVASSKLQRKIEEATLVPPADPSVVEPVKVFGDVQVENANHGNGSPSWSGSLDDERWRKVENEFGGAEGGSKKVNDGEVEVLGPANQTERNNSIDFSFLNMDGMETEKKPPVSGRFPSRKSVKSHGEAMKPLGVSKPKRHDTLESTWKAITDGRAVPLPRHLRKSDTWDNRLRRNDENTPPPPRVKKSETFSDGSDATAAANSIASRTGPGKLRREPSPGQDELNRRVEAFIRKFNEEMRLQREESLKRCQEMIRRGAA